MTRQPLVGNSSIITLSFDLWWAFYLIMVVSLIMDCHLIECTSWIKVISYFYNTTNEPSSLTLVERVSSHIILHGAERSGAEWSMNWQALSLAPLTLLPKGHNSGLYVPISYKQVRYTFLFQNIVIPAFLLFPILVLLATIGCKVILVSFHSTKNELVLQLIEQFCFILFCFVLFFSLFLI